MQLERPRGLFSLVYRTITRISSCVASDRQRARRRHPRQRDARAGPVQPEPRISPGCARRPAGLSPRRSRRAAGSARRRGRTGARICAATTITAPIRATAIIRRIAIIAPAPNYRRAPPCRQRSHLSRQGQPLLLPPRRRHHRPDHRRPWRRRAGQHHRPRRFEDARHDPRRRRGCPARPLDRSQQRDLPLRRSAGGGYSAASRLSAPPRSTETSRLTPRSTIVTPNRRCIRAIVTALWVTIR